jgi:hypothetical protein
VEVERVSRALDANTVLTWLLTQEDFISSLRARDQSSVIYIKITLGHKSAKYWTFTSFSLHGIRQKRGGLLTEHLKEGLVSMMCLLEGSLYCFAHSIIAVCTHCAGVLQYTIQVCVCVYRVFWKEEAKY